jgi:hypothetical protein
MCKFQDRQARHMRVLDVLDGYTKEFLRSLLRLPWEGWPPDFQDITPQDIANYLVLNHTAFVGAYESV